MRRVNIALIVCALTIFIFTCCCLINKGRFTKQNGTSSEKKVIRSEQKNTPAEKNVNAKEKKDVSLFEKGNIRIKKKETIISTENASQEKKKDSLSKSELIQSEKKNTSSEKSDKIVQEKNGSLQMAVNITPEKKAGIRKELEAVTVPMPKKLTFGSEKILKACWNESELRGNANERTITRPYKSNLPNYPAKFIPKYKMAALNAEKCGSIRRITIPDNIKVLALTFDLCERENEFTGYDERIVNYLRENKIKATFFAGGKWMRSHPIQTKQLMADPLFEIGNHAWTHGNLRRLHGENMAKQVLWTQAQYELLRHELIMSPCARKEGPQEIGKIPQIPYLFRFPYGTCDQESLNYLAKQGLAAIQWDVVTEDPAPEQTSTAIVREVLNKSRSGSIIIMHANGRGRATAEALIMFVPQLIKEGFKFVTVSELLQMGNPYATKECYELKSGDNFHYDRIFGEGTW